MHTRSASESHDQLSSDVSMALLHLLHLLQDMTGSYRGPLPGQVEGVYCCDIGFIPTCVHSSRHTANLISKHLQGARQVARLLGIPAIMRALCKVLDKEYFTGCALTQEKLKAISGLWITCRNRHALVTSYSTLTEETLCLVLSLPPETAFGLTTLTACLLLGAQQPTKSFAGKALTRLATGGACWLWIVFGRKPEVQPFQLGHFLIVGQQAVRMNPSGLQCFVLPRLLRLMPSLQEISLTAHNLPLGRCRCLLFHTCQIRALQASLRDSHSLICASATDIAMHTQHRQVRRPSCFKYHSRFLQQIEWSSQGLVQTPYPAFVHLHLHG